MKQHDIVVFLGPTMARNEASAILNAIYLPPVRQSDILSVLKEYSPKIIAIIDGEFSQSLAVWHKEIIFAIESGVKVFGAASMGALRAAETADYGMVGVGVIYEWYKSNELRDDDEVALIYAPESMNYLNISHSMVNIRATVNVAIQNHLIDEDLAHKMLSEAKSLHFCERKLDVLCSRLNLDEQDASSVIALFSEHYVDQKKLDAIDLLKKIEQGEYCEKDTTGDPLSKTSFFAIQNEQDSWVSVQDAQITQRELCKHAALNNNDFCDLRNNVLSEQIQLIFASHIGLDIDSEELEKEKDLFLKSKHLDSQLALTNWLKSHHLSTQDFDALINNKAVVKRLHKWFITKQGGREITKIVLDEIKFSGGYLELIKATASKFSMIRDNHSFITLIEPNTKSLTSLIASHHMNTGWKIPLDIFEWIELSGFNDVEELRQELLINTTAAKKFDALKRKVVDAW
jgi:hypothetical protein